MSVVASVSTVIVVAVEPGSVVLVVGPPVSVTTASVVLCVPAVVPVPVGVSVAVPSLSLVGDVGAVVSVVGCVADALTPDPSSLQPGNSNSATQIPDARTEPAANMPRQ